VSFMLAGRVYNSGKEQFGSGRAFRCTAT
jgi:hypothetical protein